jgi:release factor glutamine methyltransferase
MKAESIGAVLSKARAALAPSETAGLDARLLLQEACGLTQLEVIADPQRLMTSAQMEIFNAFMARRLAHEPVSRILGRREFFGRTFKVTPAVLDPRPDTECVVELALRLVGSGRFADLGTGSGIIAITLCTENANLSGLAIDISREALTLARENAATFSCADRIVFRHGSWLEGVDEDFDLIISNPPYIAPDEILAADVRDFDPHVALFSGVDGLDAYRAIAAQAPSRLRPKGHVVVEIGHGQAQDVGLIFAAQGFVLTQKATDIAGHNRALAFRMAA